MKGFFTDKPYPGRFIVIGMAHGAGVVLYGATGRSASSLKRRFVEQGDGVYMTSVDSTVAIEGNPELLEYPAIRIFENGIVAANGNQIERIESLSGMNASKLLSDALANEEYEPDEYKTPRITGCIIGGETVSAALHIIRPKGDVSERFSWDVPFRDGEGLYISTYPGDDIRPTPPFPGAPLPFPLRFESAKEGAQMLYDVLAPLSGKLDYRVGCVAAVMKKGEMPDVAIINRLENVV